MNSNFKRDFSDKRTLEKYSSAYTLSDMEIFVFPELFYPLVLSNIMSPIIWNWRNDPWFDGIEKKSFNYKSNRIKQYIIQNYVFNLDLSTWGLTTKTMEIERFSGFIDMELLKQSNALFGYEGDKYYFDIDIRKHFGLDKYNSDVIPYWKTETVEAMTAFRHKENFLTGGGECVSLSALYAAAMFVIGRIPLEKIFLIATPLHSQNFIIEKEGLITNNRRIVTKNMWFNGTSLSEKARRALENEKVTIVAHISGYIHTLYDEATIDRQAYEWFSGKLRNFLSTDLTGPVFINFLRFKSRYKSHFYYLCVCSGNPRYILLEKMFEYEHNSKFSVALETREQLMNEIEGDEFHMSPLPGKMLLNEAERILESMKDRDLKEIENEFVHTFGDENKGVISDMFREIREFIITVPRLPEGKKNHIETPVPFISTDHTREEIYKEITSKAGSSEICNLAIYAYRQMDNVDWTPFVKAAIERNPVALTELEGKNTDEVYNILTDLPDESIYNGPRLSLPDEVWNFKRGDGIEKAFLLAGFIVRYNHGARVGIEISENSVNLGFNGMNFKFSTGKKLKRKIHIDGGEYKIV
jgi:hypothetical protein